MTSNTTNDMMKRLLTLCMMIICAVGAWGDIISEVYDFKGLNTTATINRGTSLGFTVNNGSDRTIYSFSIDGVEMDCSRFGGFIGGATDGNFTLNTNGLLLKSRILSILNLRNGDKVKIDCKLASGGSLTLADATLIGNTTDNTFVSGTEYTISTSAESVHLDIISSSNNNYIEKVTVTPYYDITVTQPTDGTVGVKVGNADVTTGNTTAPAGQTITLSNTPADNYTFTSYSVTKTASGDAIELTENSFTMPKEAVTITATFTQSTPAVTEISSVEIAGLVAPEKGVALKTLSDLSTTTTGASISSITWNPTTTPAAASTTYTAAIVLEASSGYQFASTVTANEIAGKTATITRTDDTHITVAYTFDETEAEQEASISAEKTWTFEDLQTDQSYNAITLINNEYYLRCSTSPNRIYTVKECDSQTLTFSDGLSKTITKYLKTNGTLQNYGNDMAPTLTAGAYTTTSGGGLVASNSFAFNTTVPGTIFVYGNVETASKKFRIIFTDGTNKKTKDITPETSAVTEVCYSAGAGSFFVASPETNGNIYAVRFVPATTIKVPTGLTGGTVTADKATANEGDEVTLTVTPADGYQLKEGTLKAYYISANGTETEVTITNNKFTKPAYYVYVKAEFEEAAVAEISSVEIAGLVAPVKGEALKTLSDLSTTTTGVSISNITWDPTTTPAAASTAYTATIVLEASSGYQFASSVTSNEIAGKTATVTRTDDTHITVAYTFDATASDTQPATITAEATQSVTYNGTPQAVTASVSGGSYIVTYYTNEGHTEGETTDAPTNAGTYYAIVSQGDAGYTSDPVNVTFTINKATLTATADNKSKTAGEANPDLTVTVTGFVNNENASTAAGYTAPTATTEATTESQAGEYTITVSGGSADNYDFQYTNGTLTVTAATPVSTVPVFIVAGQSNADGRILSTNYDKPYSYSKTQISYCNGTTMKTEGSFATFDATCDASGKRWGFDAVLYGCLESALDEYYIVKQSKGSTAINTTYNATGLCWNASTDYLAANTSANAEGLSLAKALVSNVKTSVQALADQGKTADLKCLIWHQGESDRNDAANYKTNLETLMTYIRAELATIDEKYASLPIICGTISKYSKQYNATIEAAFKNNSLSNFYYIDMAKASMYAEDHQDVHFDATSATYLGKKLFNKLIELNLISATAVEVADLVEPTNVTRTYDFLSWTKDNLADASTYQRLVLDKTDTSHKDVKENNVYVIEDPEGSMDNLFLEGRFALSEYTEGASAQNDAINLRGNNGLRINSGNTAVLSILNLNPGDAVTITGKKGGDDATTLRFLSTNAFKSGNAQTATVSEGDTWTIGTSESGSETYIIKTGNQLDLTFGNTGSHHLYMVKIQPETATIKSEYKVTATVSGPDGSGSVVVMNGEEETAYDADTEYVEGTTVTLKAMANEGYQFANWTDADDNVLTTDLDYVDAISDNLITLRMTQAVNIKAVFEVETIVKSASVVYDYATATNINTDNSVKRTLTYNNGTEETSGGFRYEREGETKQRVLSFSNTGGFTEGSGLTFGSNSRPFGIEGLKRGDVIRIIHNGTVNTSANAASTGTTITDISDNAYSEGNIASGQEIKVATADATNDYIVLQASANITISQIAINKGIKPRVNLTNIDGNVFTYSAQFYEGEVLHYTGPGINGEQTVEYTANNNGSVTITADITNGEGNLVCWTTYDDVASDEVTINVAPINDDANTGKDDDIYDFQTWVTEMGAKGTLTRGGSDITVEGSNKVKQIQNIYASGKENSFMETHGRFAINANADVGYDKNDETKRGLRTNGDGRTAYFSILNLKSGDNITINNGVTVEGKSALRFVSTNAHKKGSTTTPSGDVDNRTVWTSGDTWVMDADGRLDLMLGDADCMAYIYSIRISNRENVAAATFAKDADDDNKLIITAGTTDVETATTYYTLDGTEPTTSSTAITSSPLTLALTQDTTLITLTVGSTGKTARGYYQFTYTDTTPTAAKTFDFFNIYKNDPTFDLQMEDATKRTAYFAKKDGESMVDNSGNFYAIKASPIDSIIAWREKHVELTANGLKPTNADRPFVIRDLKKNDVIRIEFDGDIYYAKHSTRGNALKDMEPGDAITTRTAYKVASVDDTYNYVVFYPTKATTISQISINEELTPHVLPTVPSVAFSKVEERKSVYTITYQDGETLHYQLGSDSQVDVTTASPYTLKIDKSATLSAWTSTDDGESGKLSYGVYAPTDSVYADGVYDFTKVAGTTPVEIVTAGQTVGGQTVYAPNAITSATFDRRFAFSTITGTDVRLIGGTGMRVAKGKNVYIALKNLEKDKVLAINFTSTSGDDGIKFKSVSILDGATVDANVVSGQEYTINEAGNILLQVSNANASLDITSIKLGSKMKTEQADVEYQVVNNEATVTGFTTAETASEITVPASVDGAPVTAIAEGTFTEENTANVTSIDLSETAVTFDGTTRETIDELKNINEATLIYLPSTANVTGTNVVTKTGTGTDATYTCDDYQIKDGQESSVPHAFTAAQAKITRTFTSGVKCTVCLPYQFTASGGSFYKFTGISNDIVEMTEQTGTLDANTPYIFVPSNDATEGASASNVTVSISDAPETVNEAAHFTFKGTFEKTIWDEATAEGIYGFAANAQDGAEVGQFVRVGASASIDAYRAYLKYEGEGTLIGPSSAPRRAPIVLPNTLSIKWIPAQSGATTIRNIEVNGDDDAPAYNLSGQRVGKDYKGIVIVNGKKVRK